MGTHRSRLTPPSEIMAYYISEGTTGWTISFDEWEELGLALRGLIYARPRSRLTVRDFDGTDNILDTFEKSRKANARSKRHWKSRATITRLVENEDGEMVPKEMALDERSESPQYVIYRRGIIAGGRHVVELYLPGPDDLHLRWDFEDD